MMKPFALSVVLLSAEVLPALLPISVAHAQDDATTKAARARFQEGVDAYDKGQFEQARASFLQAYALKRHPAVLLNLALSCEKSNHPLEASKYFQQYMRDSSNIPAEKRTEAEKGLAEVRAKLGRIEVTAPAGADIFVDGDRVGTAPLQDAIDVDPGPHTVLAKSPEGPLEQRTTASAGQRARVTLGAAPPAKDPPRVEKPVEPQPTPSPEPQPTQASPAPSQPPDSTATKPGLLSPPATMAPVYVGLGLAGVGLVGTVVFAIAKSSAQDSVTKVESQLKAAGAKQGECANPTPRFVQGCQTFIDNRNAVDTDATIANISAVVMVVGIVGAGAWYLFAPKKQKEAAYLTPTFRLPLRPGDDLGGGLTFSTSY